MSFFPSQLQRNVQHRHDVLCVCLFQHSFFLFFVFLQDWNWMVNLDDVATPRLKFYSVTILN